MLSQMFAYGLPGPGEIWPILLVIIVLFGAKKLPELARGMGEGMKEFKKAVKEVHTDDTADTEKPTETVADKPAAP